MGKRELELLRDKILLFHDFMVEKSNMPNELIKVIKSTNELINKLYERKALDLLKGEDHEVDLQIRELPLYLSLELDKLFQEKLGISIDSINKKMEKEIQKVIKRGKILNEKEYRLIKNREDEIYVDNSKAEEKQQLDRLMEAYEESTGANNV